MDAPTNETGQKFCIVCGRTTGVEEHDGLAACSSHFDEVFAQCSVCGQYVNAEKVEMWKRDSSHCGEEEGQVFCKPCADRRSRGNPNSHWLHCDWELMESSHAVGVEIECMNNSGKSVETLFREHAEQMRFFSQHHDGSVNGDGLELVSSPLPMSQFKQIIRRCKWMERNLKVDSSCGLHIHLNMRPWIVFEEADLEELGTILQKLTLGLLRIEDFMYSAQPKTRRPNGDSYNFCQKIKTAIRGLRDKSLQDIERMTPVQFVKTFFREENYGGNINSISDLSRDKMGIRYCWANLSAITMHDTIEFRGHSGTTSAKKMEMWVRCMDKIVSHILDCTTEELRSFGPDTLPEILDDVEMKYLNDRITKFARRD